LTVAASFYILNHVCFFVVTNSYGMLKQVIAEFLSTEEVGDIKEMFKKIDTDNDGIVSIEELKAGLKNLGSHLAEPEVQMLIEAVSCLLF
jgi:Ca2+-binding EF-hand superfamily protein